MLLTTPLTDLHLALGAKMAPFAGYTMPISYPTGIIAEHQHTRSQAGLFDVSHMGQVLVHGLDLAASLERVMPADLIGLPPMKSTYSFLTNDAGGVRDDLIVTRLDDERFSLVLNAANKEADLAYLRASLPALTFTVMGEKALLALQGPESRRVLSRLSPDIEHLPFMTAMNTHCGSVASLVTCCGYTGEDGFEISVDSDDAAPLVRALLAEAEVAPIGLGARDSLRLEVGLCLHGHELAADITPIEAGLRWAIAPARRSGGVRHGNYPGAGVIDQQIENGVPRQRVGLRVLGRRPVRAGQVLVDQAGHEVGRICSDAFGASVGGPVAMAYVLPEAAAVGFPLKAESRGTMIDVEVAALPMFTQRYHRG